MMLGVGGERGGVVIFNEEWNLGAVTHNTGKMLSWWSVVVSRQIKCGQY